MMDEALTSLGFNRGWLHSELEKAGVAPENVFIAQVDSAGQVYLDLFDDSINIPAPKTKALAYHTLRKCQADSELYALATQNPQAKDIYTSAATVLAEVTAELESWLLR